MCEMKIGFHTWNDFSWNLYAYQKNIEKIEPGNAQKEISYGNKASNKDDIHFFFVFRLVRL